MPVEKPAVTSRPTPNRSRRHGRVCFVVLHDTVGTYPGDLDYLTSASSGVSSDFYFRRDGRVWQLNPNLSGQKTWHAGVSAYEGYSNLNEYALGIEQEHGPDAADWPGAQVAACAQLAAWAVEEFDLDLTTHPLVGHAHVALPAGRKSDPRDFPWPDFLGRVRRLLGAVRRRASLIWPIGDRPESLDLFFVRGDSFALGSALTALTGLRPLVTLSEDGYAAVRPFFEAHGFRVEWDGQARQLRISPQDFL